MDNRLAQLREEKGLSQTDVGKDLNVAQNTISQWEQGTRNINIEMLIRLADYYQVSIDYLIGRSNNKVAGNQTNNIKELSGEEINHIKKYRALDERGKEAVDETLEREYANSLKTGLNAICDITIE